MNKQDLIAAVANKAGLTNVDSARAINAFLSVVEEELRAGQKVVITGFGQFEAKKRAARTGINPATKQTIKIPACKVPAFKAGKALKDALKK